jgi:hypothetical protein
MEDMSYVAEEVADFKVAIIKLSSFKKRRTSCRFQITI